MEAAVVGVAFDAEDEVFDALSCEAKEADFDEWPV